MTTNRRTALIARVILTATLLACTGCTVATPPTVAGQNFVPEMYTAPVHVAPGIEAYD